MYAFYHLIFTLSLMCISPRSQTMALQPSHTITWNCEQNAVMSYTYIRTREYIKKNVTPTFSIFKRRSRKIKARKHCQKRPIFTWTERINCNVFYTKVAFELSGFELLFFVCINAAFYIITYSISMPHSALAYSDFSQ